MILKTQYKKVYNNLVKEHNFNQTGDTFYRLKNNEIVQTVSLDKGVLRNFFTIKIGLFPLCIGFNEEQIVRGGTFNLGQLLNNIDTKWEYKPMNLTDIEFVLKATNNIVLDTIIPIFSSVVNCETYLEFIKNTQEEVYGYTLQNSSAEVFTHLKLNNYKNALYIINNIETQNYEAAAANKYGYSEEEYKEYLENIEEDLYHLKCIRFAIQRNDNEYIKSILQKNESKSIDTIIKLNKKLL